VAQTHQACLGRSENPRRSVDAQPEFMHHATLHFHGLLQPLQELSLMAHHLGLQHRTLARAPALAGLRGIAGELVELHLRIAALAVQLHEGMARRIALAPCQIDRDLESLVRCHEPMPQ